MSAVSISALFDGIIESEGFTNNGSTVTTHGPHNLTTGEKVVIEGCRGITNLNDKQFVVTVTGPDEFTIPASAEGTYTGGGTVSPGELA